MIPTYKPLDMVAYNVTYKDVSSEPPETSNLLTVSKCAMPWVMCRHKDSPIP